LPELRAGVRLSPLKAHIFDVIKRADSNGITIADINTICFDGRASAVNVRNHIHQINDALAGTDLEIRGGAPGMVGYFHIVSAKRPAKNCLQILGRLDRDGVSHGTALQCRLTMW